MLAELKKVPNLLTAFRLVAIPAMWPLAFTGHSFWIGVGLVLVAVSDAVDGVIARRLGQASEFGSKFDSFADGLIGPSVVTWLLVLQPEIYTENPELCLTWISVTAASLAVGFVKFRRFANLHLYSAKAAAFAQYPFVFNSFFFETYSPVLFYLAVGTGILASFETLVLQLTQSEVDEHMGSIVHALLDESR